MSDYKLDKIDLKILKLLQENSKITNLDLSQDRSLSCPHFGKGKKLEQAGIILSYHAKVDSTAIGLNVKRMFWFHWHGKSQTPLKNFIKKVKQVDEITECYIITGDADFLLKIVCKDIPTYEKLLFKTLLKLKKLRD